MCGKTGDGMSRLVGDAFSVGSPPGLCQWMGMSLTGQPEVNIPPGLLCLDPQLRWIDFACLLLVTTLMKMIH